MSIAPLGGGGVFDSVDATDSAMKKVKGGGFQTMGLSKEFLQSIFRMGFQVPPPIQRKAIPACLQGSDVVAMARTGSGKTGAYTIPLIHRLEKHSTVVGVRGVILAPTRELVLQISQVFRKLAKHTDLRCVALVGGTSLDAQFAALASNPDVTIASPGRILHMCEEAKLGLGRVSHVVLDEADRLFELGLQPQIVAILQRIPDNAQRALFSATMPTILAEFTDAKLTNPLVIRLDSETKLSPTLRTATFVVRSHEKVAGLLYVVKTLVVPQDNMRALRADGKTQEKQQALVFVESKFQVEYLEELLKLYGYKCHGVHGGMDQEARKDAVADFSKKKVELLVVTDLAARGLDIPLLDNVVNFNFPAQPKLFIHRVGRVARAGRDGCAYNIIAADEMAYYIELCRFLGRDPICRKPSADADGAFPDSVGAMGFRADDGCHGRLPEAALAREYAHSEDVLARNEDTVRLGEVAKRALGKFTRTKQKVSGTAGHLSRERGTGVRYEELPVHPMFQVDDKMQLQEDAVRGLRNFKTKETVLDLQAGGRIFEPKPKVTLQTMNKAAAEEHKKAAKDESGKPAPRAPPKSLAERLMQQAQSRKHGRDDTVVGDAAARRPSKAADLFAEGASGYADANFCLQDKKEMTTADSEHLSTLAGSAVDFNAESAEGQKQQRSVYAWSKQKNRYVRMAVNDAKALLKGIKNESGANIDFKSKQQHYVKWTQASNLRIPDVGEQEDAGVTSRALGAWKNKGVAKDDANDNGPGDDEDAVDISDPNMGRKLRVGRKQKRLPKDGRVRSFDELRDIKRKKAKDAAKLEARRAKKAGKKRK